MRSEAAALIVIVAVIGAACRQRRQEGPPYSAARVVVERHCVGCHSQRPTVPAFPVAPGGLVLDTSELMQMHAARIKLRVVQKRDMPLLNKSEMTEDERALLGAWVDSGAVGPPS